MSELKFMTIVLDKNSSEGFRLVDLSSEQLERKDDYRRALVVAEKSQVANPPFSNYFCKESAGLAGGHFVAAGNIEYGLCQANHGEESAVAAFRAEYGRHAGGHIVLGIVSAQDAPPRPAAPCGNCRDIMLEDFGQDFEIIRGNPNGGTAVVVPMRYYLHKGFAKLDWDSHCIYMGADDTDGISKYEFKRLVLGIINKSKRMENVFYVPKAMHPERQYYALIVTAKREIYGTFDGMCDYHPIYALRSAVHQAVIESDFSVQYVVVAAKDFGGDSPQPMYKDRQHLLELNLYGELVAGKEKTPKVFLATYGEKDGHQVITGAWQTNVKEWLPFPFTARNFMNLEEMAAYYQAKAERY